MPAPVRKPPFRISEAFASHGALKPNLLVLHSTEGGTPKSVVGTLRGRGYGIHWIVGENGGVIRGNVDQVLYHCAGYNARTIGIEQCGFAAWTEAQWMRRRTELLATAWCLAFDATRHGIPLRYVEPSSVTDATTGVTTHAALGVTGGDHHDPGSGYPISHVIGMANSIQNHGLGLLERARVALACHRVN